MTDQQFSDMERRVLSYISRGVSRDTAVQKIATFFGIKAAEVQPVVDKLRRGNFVIESKGISGVVVYTTSPLKVKQAMLDQGVIEQLKASEGGAKAGGFKKKTFDIHTGAVAAEDGKKAKRSVDLGFDVE